VTQEIWFPFKDIAQLLGLLPPNAISRLEWIKFNIQKVFTARNTREIAVQCHQHKKHIQQIVDQHEHHNLFA